LNEAINLLPNDETAYLSLADIYLSRGESERALTIYQRCLNLNAENSQAYFKAGVLYKELKDYPNAEQMLRQAARLEPNNLAIQRQLGAVIALNLIHTQRTKEKNNP
jgi:tetratricopeptide (TPR) repeat protein